jgi:hypothetical protein
MDDLKIVRRHAAIRNVKESGTEKSVPNGTKKMKNIFEQIICKRNWKPPNPPNRIFAKAD